MSYTKRTCSQCGIRDVQPNMVRKTIKSESGHSKRTLSPLTFLGLAVSDKKSIGAVKERLFNSSQRTYYRSRDIWLCEECSGVAAGRRKQQEQAEQRRLNERRKQELAAERETRRVEAYNKRKQEEIAQQVIRRDILAREKRNKEALEKIAKSASDQRTTNSQRNKAAMLQLSNSLKSDATSHSDLQRIRVALRKRPLIFVRTVIEATVLSFLIIVIGILLDISFELPKLAVRTISSVLVGIPIYTVVVYMLRSRRTMLERRKLINDFTELNSNPQIDTNLPDGLEIHAATDEPTTHHATEKDMAISKIDLTFELSNGDTGETGRCCVTHA